MALKFRKQHGLTGKELTVKIPPCIKPHQIREVTILPVHGGKAYKIEFCYKVPTQPKNLDQNQYLAIDLGLNNIATMVDTATGAAVILDGKRIKSPIHRFSRHRRACTAAGKKGAENQRNAKMGRLYKAPAFRRV
jgi:transposase